MAKEENPEIPDNSTTAKSKVVKKGASKKTDSLKRATLYLEFLSKIFGLITWQVVVLIAIVLFYTPLRQMADLLPAKFARSSEINVGVLSLKIQEEAKASGNEELATIITGLSKEAIEVLLDLGNGSYRVIGSDDGGTGIVKNYYLARQFPVWKELEDRGLIHASKMNLNDFEKFFFSLNPTEVGTPTHYLVPINGLTTQQHEKLLDNSVELTETGKIAYEIIITVVSDMITQK